MQQIRLACRLCDRDDFDFVEKLPSDWFSIETVPDYEATLREACPDNDVRVFDWLTPENPSSRIRSPQRHARAIGRIGKWNHTVARLPSASPSSSSDTRTRRRRRRPLQVEHTA